MARQNVRDEREKAGGEYPFERFQSLAKALVRVPTSEMEEDIAKTPDEVLFQKTGCHIFAIELKGVFENAGRTDIELFWIPINNMAGHVLLKGKDGFYDSKFGPRTQQEVMKDWNEDYALPELVKNLKHLTEPSPKFPDGMRSGLGLRVAPPEYVELVRSRARSFIERNRALFGLR